MQIDRGEEMAEDTVLMLNDGRQVKCSGVASRSCGDAEFCSGLIENTGPEAIYITLEVAGEDSKATLFLSFGEAQALLWVLTGAMWATTKRGALYEEGG